MSWFDTLKSVATTVGKTLVHITGGPNPELRGSFALPYRGNNYRVNTNDSDSDDEGLAVPRITTRARLTYELDRFQKNAMLMFVQMNSGPRIQGMGCRDEETTTQDMNVLIDTFSSFRFEVSTHINLTCSGIETKCQEFFQQDFNDYGAVIVVVLTFEGTTGQLSAVDGRFEESIIMTHFTDNMNITLLDKPKIYITEANRTISPNGGPQFSLQITEHQDILGFNLPSASYAPTIRRPLLIVCDNINKMADTSDLVTILEKSVKDIDAEANSISGNIRIELCNKLTKEMIFARSEQS